LIEDGELKGFVRPPRGFEMPSPEIVGGWSSLIGVFVALLMTSALAGQSVRPADVASIDAILAAYYTRSSQVPLGRWWM
jgi:hypothetical protein